MTQPSSSRRAFLGGRRAHQHPWQRFIQALQRSAPGEVLDFGLQDDCGRASWSPLRAESLMPVAALCKQHGVVLALDSLNRASALADQSVLWVDPLAHLNGCQALPDMPGRWLVQPGCMVATARAAGLTQFAPEHDYLTVAAWLADRSICHWPAGRTEEAGLLYAGVMFEDTTTAVLGPFGVRSGAGLETLFLQRTVPALFQLATSPLAQACQSQHYWPGRYRLDALLPTQGASVNLAHLLLGHGGDLAWTQWMVFEPRPPLAEQDATQGRRFRAPEQVPVEDEDQARATVTAAELDAGIKALLDPQGLFPHPGQIL